MRIKKWRVNTFDTGCRNEHIKITTAESQKRTYFFFIQINDLALLRAGKNKNETYVRRVNWENNFDKFRNTRFVDPHPRTKAI